VSFGHEAPHTAQKGRYSKNIKKVYKINIFKVIASQEVQRCVSKVGCEKVNVTEQHAGHALRLVIGTETAAETKKNTYH
jgi:hypothetical protein